eukprot:m.128164 g.128164  ORF g.128164 m.128164 type:complete len:313 (-) comp9407_c1_seq3:604-1542(-)
MRLVRSSRWSGSAGVSASAAGGSAGRGCAAISRSSSLLPERKTTACELRRSTGCPAMRARKRCRPATARLRAGSACAPAGSTLSGGTMLAGWWACSAACSHTKSLTLRRTSNAPPPNAAMSVRTITLTVNSPPPVATGSATCTCSICFVSASRRHAAAHSPACTSRRSAAIICRHVAHRSISMSASASARAAAGGGAPAATMAAMAASASCNRRAWAAYTACRSATRRRSAASILPSGPAAGPTCWSSARGRRARAGRPRSRAACCRPRSACGRAPAGCPATQARCLEACQIVPRDFRQKALYPSAGPADPR